MENLGIYRIGVIHLFLFINNENAQIVMSIKMNIYLYCKI